MKLAHGGVAALAVLCSTGLVASPAFARDNVDRGDDIDPAPRPTRPTRPVVVRELDVQRDLELPARFRALSESEQAAQLQGAVPETQAPANAPEELVDLGDVDTTEEDMPEYGIVRMRLLTPVVGGPIRPVPPIVVGPILDPVPTTGCGGAPQTNWSQVWSKSDTFGNSKFGAGYEGKITLASQASPTPNMDKLSGEAVGRAYGTLLGLSKDLARVTLKAALQGSQGSSSINVKVLGSDIYNKSIAGNLEAHPSWNRSFFSASQRIWLGPVPVKVTASANGRIGLDYKTTYEGAKVTFTGKPYANAYASASAAVDIAVASAGVTGNLTLLDASVPASAVLTIQPTWISYDVDADLRITSLSGRIDLWAKVWYLFGSKKWTTTLAKWNGVTATIPIVHAVGCKPLAS